MNSLRSREIKCCGTRALGPVGIPGIRASCRAEVLSVGTSLIQRYPLLLLQLCAVLDNPGNTYCYCTGTFHSNPDSIVEHINIEDI